jgi:group I intron endonuclease
MNKKFAGIYCIKNTLNNKVYIGSSLSISTRLKNHKVLLRKNKHHSYKLQGAFNKHGEDTFKFEILEEVFFSLDHSSEYKVQILECIEQTYISKYNAAEPYNYNVSPIAGRVINPNNSFSDNTKKSWLVRREKGQDKFSEEHKANLSLSLRNSQALKDSAKISSLKRFKKVYQYDSEGNFTKEWRCIGDITLNCPELLYNGLRKNIKGKTIFYKNFIFSYNKFDKITIRKPKQRKKRNGESDS